MRDSRNTSEAYVQQVGHAYLPSFPATITSIHRARNKNYPVHPNTIEGPDVIDNSSTEPYLIPAIPDYDNPRTAFEMWVLHEIFDSLSAQDTDSSAVLHGRAPELMAWATGLKNS
jgi:hypothetical protein